MEISKITFATLAQKEGITQSFESLDINNDGSINSTDLELTKDSKIKTVITNLLNEVDSDDCEVEDDDLSFLNDSTKAANSDQSSASNITVVKEKGQKWNVLNSKQNTTETLSLQGCTIKVTKNSSSASFKYQEHSFSSNDNIRWLSIDAQDCTIEIVSLNSEINNKDKRYSVKLRGDNITFNSTAALSKISNRADNSTINGSTQDDKILNHAKNCIINGGEGNDYIEAGPANNTINAGCGDNKIIANGKALTINGGDGNDYISVSGSRNTVNAGKGDDTIKNRSSYSTINGNEGDDTISNTARQVTIHGNTGKDKISNTSSNVTIHGDEDDDTIESKGYSNTINGDDGDDTITNTVVKRIDGVTYKISSVPSLIDRTKRYFIQRETTIDGGSGKDTITNSGYFVTINEAEELDSINIIQPDNIANGQCGAPVIYAAKIDTVVNYKKS